MFILRIKRKALRYVERLDLNKKNAVKETMLLLKTDPVPVKKRDVSKLRGYDSIYRIRIGDLKIVYRVLWSERTIVVIYIGPRGKAY